MFPASPQLSLRNMAVIGLLFLGQTQIGRADFFTFSSKFANTTLLNHANTNQYSATESNRMIFTSSSNIATASPTSAGTYTIGSGPNQFIITVTPVQSSMGTGTTQPTDGSGNASNTLGTDYTEFNYATISLRFTGNPFLLNPTGSSAFTIHYAFALSTNIDSLADSLNYSGTPVIAGNFTLTQTTNQGSAGYTNFSVGSVRDDYGSYNAAFKSAGGTDTYTALFSIADLTGNGLGSLYGPGTIPNNPAEITSMTAGSSTTTATVASLRAYFGAGGLEGTNDLAPSPDGNGSFDLVGVPEPASITLFSLGAIVAAGYAFRKSRKP